MNLADAIKKELEEKGMTQVELGEKSQTTTSSGSLLHPLLSLALRLSEMVYQPHYSS